VPDWSYHIEAQITSYHIIIFRQGEPLFTAPPPLCAGRLVIELATEVRCDSLTRIGIAVRGCLFGLHSLVCMSLSAGRLGRKVSGVATHSFLYQHVGKAVSTLLLCSRLELLV